MPFTIPPITAAWRHLGDRSGFEVVYFSTYDNGWRAEGCTTAAENDQTWMVRYDIRLDATWTTRTAQIWGRSSTGPWSTLLESDGQGNWLVNGEPAPHLTGCHDVDLESSAMTNTFPIHRMDPPANTKTPAPAAYVRIGDRPVDRLDQTYLRLPDDGPHLRYDYASPAFDFTCVLIFDESGLVLDYPEIAIRTQ
ncbi:putative glycolipid-binding domain-containing protein [Acrocarpospora catenulata]|uniref:putative glycolipid-binding domain-containing protein n=1 Tax=Acrocarpospora catenulata TaxID=2836182 RepID=UPI001BDAB82C|nr:putative glycolipid-binding domain-containing protein [Acrocarpospora catenulata]